MGWNMVSAEKTSIKKRKDKKRELCSPWEGPTANDGLDDERMLDVFQRAKQQVQLKCRFVDERNIVVSPHLLGKCFWTSEPHGNDEEEKSCSAQFHKPQDKSPSPVEEPEPPVAAPAEPSPLNQTNTKITTDYSTHKHNIIYSLSPAQTSPQELKPNLPLIRWAPPAARVVVMEEPVARRSKPFTTVDHKPTSDEPLWKLASAKRVEWCHESLARLAKRPNKGSSANRRKPVIHKMSRITANQRGFQTENRSVDRIYSPTLIPKALHSEDTKVLAPPVHHSNQTLYSCFWSAVKAEEGGHGKKTDQKDKCDNINSDFSINCSNVSCLSDLLCPSECPGKDDPSIRNVTLFHILQVLQSKPGTLPQVTVHRRLRTLSSLKNVTSFVYDDDVHHYQERRTIP